jgi:hypothetical protein
VLKLMHIEEPIYIFLSHDWPLGITDYGNSRRLIKAKPFFREEVLFFFNFFYYLNNGSCTYISHLL